LLASGNCVGAGPGGVDIAVADGVDWLPWPPVTHPDNMTNKEPNPTKTNNFDVFLFIDK
jgi:hypothetical protein